MNRSAKAAIINKIIYFTGVFLIKLIYTFLCYFA